MESERFIGWLLVGMFAAVGALILIVRVDPEALRAKVHTWPGFALYRFRLFRYGVAAGMFVMAAVSYLQLTR
ncbi:MAG: hypothetical protein A3H27_05700 [Acidobacteria bacterium RIFCSPLOWO2_02_FULL_59_13]|nr:MAG: hypothetical protein A3H27_05700 [Acidobacteria bacterium RIFCSPLOWO2_02_FULL_59_13]